MHCIACPSFNPGKNKIKDSIWNFAKLKQTVPLIIDLGEIK